MKVAWNVLVNVIKKLTSSNIFWYVFFAIAAYYGYKRLTRPPETTFINTPLPNSGSGIPQGWTPDDLASQFHDHFASFWVNASTLQILYTQSNSLTDDQFVTLCNFYNAKYAKLDGNKTLWTRVKSWKSIWFGTGVDEQNKFIKRMVTLKQDY
ncbi:MULTISPECIES: hypothetical protein [unclassified Arcicella]|uniref:hypothetical protein n=1 Tax=unclassified Arcicella TaxID=2644986 RepID=UPI00285875CA|nr:MULTISPECIES: hypothetical protein [unclassified Arcicella]MDR6564952.1 hypothetical protein [Arcicella sp. BE51]MDR6814742.1 hypothetical protein [Arcicella sp. BE140]MDR6826188.1 hypothetical protein [Arcicella sp. BE139]